MDAAEPETGPGEASSDGHASAQSEAGASAAAAGGAASQAAQAEAGGSGGAGGGAGAAPAAAESASEAGGDSGTTAEGGEAGGGAAEAGESDSAGGGGEGAAAGGAAGAEAAPDTPQAQGGTASGSMQPQAEAGAGAAGGSAADPEALQRVQEQSEQSQHQADNERTTQQGSQERDEDQAEQEAESGNAPAGAEAELSGPEKSAAMESVGEEQAAEGGAGGGAGGGGGAEARTEEAPPDVSGMPPEQGLATLSSATPAQADAALGGVQSAAAAENAEQTQAAHESLPQTTVGEPPSPRVTGSKGGGAGGAAGANAAAPATGAQAPKTKPAPTPAPAVGNAADKVARPQIAKPAEGAEPSDADKAQVAASISALPTSDPGLKTKLGAAPTLQLSGAADPAQMAAQKARSDQSVAAARAGDAAEVAKPMGEQNVRPTVGQAQIKARTLKAAAAGAAGGAVGGAGASGAAGGAVGGARGVLAEELKGPEVRAAMAAASAQAAAARIETQAKIAAGNAAAQAQIGDIKTQAATDQDTVSAKVRSDARNARSQYARKQEAAISQLDRRQQQTIAKTGDKAGEEKRKGEEEAAAQIEEGETQTADKAQEVETEVERKKQEAQAQTEEKGFFGRLADDLGAWFDRQKKWISEKVEAGKKWIKETADRFKKYAAEKIDQARDRVTGLIKEGGELLKSGADALLSEFPAARDAVKGVIDSGVEIGVKATNDIAEGVKDRVNRTVDGVAAVAEGALDVGGKVANAAIDYAKSTTVDALNAADKAMAALGVLKVLVEDVASDPGGWVGKLGASAKDGVANHLAAAMKAAIKQWWEGKLESVLGVGPAIWEVLKKGGLGLKEIGTMAWAAIKAAIPPALIQLVIEKVVAMIIPAAGAVMAIIEGLQAAWGSVSAMLGAVGKAIAYLKAVKGGGGGPAFAQLVAAAAVVVIDFVSNWLIAKLGKAILKIGGKIKGIAQKLLKKISAAVKKFTAKRKAKKKAKSKKKNKAARDKKAKQLREERKNRKADKDGKKKDDPAKKAQDKEAARRKKRDAAIARVKPKIAALLSKGIGKTWLGIRLRALGFTHGLKALSLKGKTITARASPEVTLETVDNAVLGAMLEPILVMAEAAYLRRYDQSRKKEEADEDPSVHHMPANADTQQIADLRASRDAGQAARKADESFRPDKDKATMPTAQGANLWWRDRSSLNTAFVQSLPGMAGMPVKYAKMIAQGSLKDVPLSALNAQQRSFFEALGSVERARKSGMMPAMDMASALHGEGVIPSAQDVVAGSANPMAADKSSVAAHRDDQHTDFTRRSPAQMKQIAGASDSRRASIGHIFKQLRAMLAKPQQDIKTQAGGAAVGVAKALEAWFNAHASGLSDDRAALVRMTQALVQKLIVFLKAYRS